MIHVHVLKCQSEWQVTWNEIYSQYTDERQLITPILKWKMKYEKYRDFIMTYVAKKVKYVASTLVLKLIMTLETEMF